jgi:hypothetical protein
MACCQPLLCEHHHLIVANLAAAAAAARALAAGCEGNRLVLTSLAAAGIVPLKPAAAQRQAANSPSAFVAAAVSSAKHRHVHAVACNTWQAARGLSTTQK